MKTVHKYLNKHTKKYKDLSLVLRVDKNLHQEKHCLASRGLPSNDMVAWDRFFFFPSFSSFFFFFYLPLAPMIDFFLSCIPFISKRRFFLIMQSEFDC